MEKRIQKPNSEQRKELLRNSKGFSLVELCVVMAIMATLIVVVASSITVIFRARAKSATEKIGSIISQCKINSLSGIDNEFTLKYDTDKKQYVCILAKRSGLGEAGEKLYNNIYKEELLGNSRVDIKIGDKSVLDGAVLKIRFSNNDGKIEAISVNNVSQLDKSLTVITVSSSRTYNLTIYNLTGEHEIEVA